MGQCFPQDRYVLRGSRKRDAHVTTKVTRLVLQKFVPRVLKRKEMTRTCRRHIRAGFRRRSVRLNSEQGHFDRVLGTEPQFPSLRGTVRPTYQVLRIDTITMYCTHDENKNLY